MTDSPGATLTVLGSGTCVPDGAHHSAAYFLELGAACVLIDCGPGTLHGLDTHAVPWRRLTHVLVSHYHTDHVGDLSAVLFALEYGMRPARTDPLTLLGPPGFGGFVDRLAELLGTHLVAPSFGVDVVELDEEAPWKDPNGAFTLEACPTPHTDESVAFRLSGPWGTLAYTGDTGPSVRVAERLAGADVLVAECSLADPPEMDRHLSPATLAELASVARPGLLVVTHVYPPLTPERAAQELRARYRGEVVAGADGLEVAIRPGWAGVRPRP